MKCDRPIGSKNITPRKRRTQRRIDTPEKVYDKQKAYVEAYDKQKAYEEVYGEQENPEKVRDKEIAPKEAQILENYEISMSYMHKGYKWDQNDIIINNIFAFHVALNIITNDEDLEPQNVEEC